jgi:parallel beta-helix repeat protein
VDFLNADTDGIIVLLLAPAAEGQNGIIRSIRYTDGGARLEGEVVQTISIPSDTSVGTWDPVNRIYTLTKDTYETLNIVEDNLTLDGAGHVVSGNGSGNGISLFTKTGVILKNLVVQKFDLGIYLHGSSGNTLRGNTICSCIRYGILMIDSGNNVLRNNLMSDNSHNFGLSGGLDFHFDNDIDTSNTTDGKPIYYVKNVIGQLYDNSTNAGTFYAISCSNITVKDLIVADNQAGVFFWNTHNSRIENVTASRSKWAICLQNSSDNTLLSGSNCNTLIGNNTSSNRANGIEIYYSNSNALTGNTASNNHVGISLDYSSNNNTLISNTASNNDKGGIYIGNSNGNTIHNNNFINNPVQAFVEGSSSGNVFNLDRPTGGNFWSDWTTPDADHDGFVDTPYVFTGGQDDLPLADDDSDGVSDVVEGGAPNGGDGNSDGILDSQQDNVTSLPNAVDEGYVTIVSPGETALENVSAGDNPSPADAPAGVEFPIGFFEFTVSGMAPGGSTTVTLLLPVGHTVGTYYKYGPTPDNPTNHWYEFLYNGTTGAEILPDRIILHFVDGQRGDNDLTANGQIVDPGAPAIDITPPTIHSISANPNVLWPVNHKMVKVTVTVDATDICDPAPICKIVSVTSNEPINGLGDGNTQPDWEITGNLTVNLCAERVGTGSGRVYTIHVNCTDASGNVAIATVDVTVLHDKGKK